MTQTTLINDIYGVVGSQGEITDLNVDGKNLGLVRAVMGPGGVVEFDATIAAAISNLGQPNQYAMTDEMLAAVPPRLWPVDSVPYMLHCAHRGYAWGRGVDARYLVRVEGVTRNAEQVFDFGSGNRIADIFEGHNCILVMTENSGDNTFTLRRSDDLGVTFTAVHDIGRDPVGGATHHPRCSILQRGLGRGLIQGRPALLFGTYNAMDQFGGTQGTQPDVNYLAYSFDDGRTWDYLGIWNWDYATGTGGRTLRHFHVCAYDRWRDCWWIGSGDTNEHSMIARWDGQTMARLGSVTPAQISAGTFPGWSASYNSQRWRTVDVLITPDWIESMTDTASTLEGGIWRMRPDFSESHRVNHDTRGKQSDGWCALTLSDGTQLWADNCRADALNANQRWIGIWGSKTGRRYHHIGRIAVSGAGVRYSRGFFELAGCVWWTSDALAGKTSHVTEIWEPRGLFREDRPDFLSPVYWVDFAAGNDSNTGHTPRDAWKTAGKCMPANAVTHGARIMLSAGQSTENGVASIDYTAQPNFAADDNTVGIQIDGQGRTATDITLSGATNGWRGTSSQPWNVDFGNLTLRQSLSNQQLLWDNSTATAGKPRWTFRDAQIGDTTTGADHALYIRQSITRGVRSIVANGTSKWGAHASVAGEITLEGCFVSKGLSTQQNDAIVRFHNCETDDATGVALLINANATQLPSVVNTIFGPGTADGMQNASALDITNAVRQNVFVRSAGAGIPTGPLPESGILDRADNRRPFAWSALKGQGASLGIFWGFDGRPMRRVPSIGMIEAD